MLRPVLAALAALLLVAPAGAGGKAQTSRIAFVAISAGSAAT